MYRNAKSLNEKSFSNSNFLSLFAKNKGSLFGFYTLGKEVKRKLLEIEGVRLR